MVRDDNFLITLSLLKEIMQTDDPIPPREKEKLSEFNSLGKGPRSAGAL
jgi:hypothetical protein